MSDDTPEIHLFPRLRRRVKRVVVAVEAVEKRGACSGLKRHLGIRRPLGRRIGLVGGALGPAPVALAYIKGTTRYSGVDVVVRGVDEFGLDLEHGTGTTFVKNIEHFASDLEAAALGGGGQGFQEGHGPLAVHGPARVELGDARDRCRFLRS